MTPEPFYQTQLPSGCHWSLRLRRGTQMTLTDVTGNSNVGMLFHNPENLLERYNAPDTLKCQHTFKLTRGNCLYSDMGRIFCSITADDFGWHETVCGNSTATLVANRWGARDYQSDRNDWHQNGYDSFLVELTKYGLGSADMASNLNWFSRVQVDDTGRMTLNTATRRAAASVTLRFEMDTLVLLHTCPHPLDLSPEYPRGEVAIALGQAAPVSEDDCCRNHCAENRRGFHNNALYHLGLGLAPASV